MTSQLKLNHKPKTQLEEIPYTGNVYKVKQINSYVSFKVKTNSFQKRDSDRTLIDSRVMLNSPASLGARTN